MNIIWNRVTKFSQAIAIVLFLAVFAVAFQLGRRFEQAFILGFPVNSVTFDCADDKSVHADFYAHFVRLKFGYQRTLYLQQTISASGARYADDKESIVFWNKGDTAFMTEGGTSTYADCVVTK